MKVYAAAVLGAANFIAALASDQGTNPVQKVMELLSSLQAKIVKEGETATKVYDEFAEWCEDRSREIGYSIKTSKAQEADLKADIEKASDEMESLSTKIEELSTSITTDESDVRAATLIREKEANDFAAVQKDLLGTIDSIERAIAILEKEAKKGTSLAQLQGVNGLNTALSTLVDASALNAADTARLTALVQSSTASDDASGGDSSELGAPDPEAYASHSNTIIETMQGLFDKSETLLEDARRTEATKKHNYELLKQALEDKLKTSNAEMDAAKKGLAEAGERRATAEGDLSVTRKDLKEEDLDLRQLHHNCMTKAADFEEEMKSRGEELAALAKAKQVIADMTSGATSQTYSLSQDSFLQVEAETDAESNKPPDMRAVQLVKRLARQQNVPALTQLSLRLDSALRAAAESGADPFTKVRGLISDMITTLEGQMSAEANHKAWCDSELAETTTKKQEKEGEIEKLTAKIDQMMASSTALTEEVAILQKELSELARSEAQMTKIRQEEHGLYLQNRPEMEDGIKGVKMALKVLREYYAKADGAEHEADSGAGSSIIGLLQVVESDFAKGLSELVAEEEAAQKRFDQQVKENEISRVTKEQDVRYKSKNLKAQEKTSTELSSDREGVRAELEAVGEYLSKLEDQCVAKAEPYEERKKRMEQLTSGLKEALQLLEGEATLLQVSSARSARHLRGVHRHRLQWG